VNIDDLINVLQQCEIIRITRVHYGCTIVRNVNFNQCKKQENIYKSDHIHIYYNKCLWPSIIFFYDYGILLRRPLFVKIKDLLLARLQRLKVKLKFLTLRRRNIDKRNNN
jgi:hypothetical protein